MPGVHLTSDRGGPPGAWSSEGQPSAHRALTLFEVMLVLVLLVVIGSLASPLLEGGFASVRLRRGADQLLAAWSEARSHAIVTGQTYQFVFVPESGDYRIEPWYADSPMLTSQASYATAGSGPPPIADDTTSYGSTTTGDGARSDWSDTASLPENITFHSGDIMEKLPDVGRELLPAAAGTPGWSKPVLFFPDGSSSAATLTLRNERGALQRITLRALTGVARASDVMSEEEAQRLQFQ